MTVARNKRNWFRFFEPFIITLFWLLLFASPFILGEFEYGVDWNHIFNLWKSFIPYLALFLINRFLLLPYLFFKNRRMLFLLANLILIANMAIAVQYFQPGRQQGRNDRMMQQGHFPRGQDEFRAPPLHLQRGPQKPPPKQLPPIISFIVISVLIIGFDTGLKLSVKWVQSEQNREKAEKQSVESQLAFLRNQVSPHFFMNTLNNIHALIDIDTEEAKESIIRLSKLMRFMLYDSEVEKIPIQKEFEFIQNYVDLMKLRFSEKVKITVKFPETIPQYSIPPLLFTSYLENAFKYGVSYQNDSFINIVFKLEKDRLHFKIQNSLHATESKEEVGGIGIANSKQRLDLLFGDRYSLSIDKNSDRFIVNLNIPL
ncbi:MAG: histidine kinase [Bacteroidales bacterium]|nr:histidine kinase [Bacteroidales bacterium]MCF8457077.1 histidine kinase [Bacteroidales bacterium]